MANHFKNELVSNWERDITVQAPNAPSKVEKVFKLFPKPLLVVHFKSKVDKSSPIFS
jgi:hypothetical protein